MGIKEAFQTGAQKIISGFGNVVDEVTITRTGQSYNSTTNEMTDTTITGRNVKMIFGKFSSEEVNRYSSSRGESILPTDVKGLVAQLDLPATLIPPKPGDEITNGTDDYSLIEFFKTPADALFILQLRKS